MIFSPRATPRLSATTASALYLAATLAMTWPLVLGLARDIPLDLGDSILNAWILQRGADRLLRFLGGEFSAFAGYWNAEIFHPEPLALAYSEHLAAQLAQAFPFYAATGNIVVAYNVVFLATFVLCGLGMFLLVRELTGSVRGAFVAGLIYAFIPYRIAQYGHLQVLSSQWMPLALFGLARYFTTRRPLPLAGAAAALVMNNLSCSYYLLFFAPFAAGYALWEIARRNLWKDARVWRQLAGAVILVAAVTTPFVVPYAQLRAAGFEPRPVREVAGFSADVYGYFTAHVLNRVWGGRAAAFAKPEGELFAGAIPLLLACAGVWLASGRILAEARSPAGIAVSKRPGTVSAAHVRTIVAGAAALLGGANVLLLALYVATGRVTARVAGVPLRVTNPARTLLFAAGAFAVLVALSPRVRAVLVRAWRSPAVLVTVATFAAWLLSLGPLPEVMGRHLFDWGPYTWLYAYVPGFDGLRVPARFGMLVMLGIAVLAGHGFAAVERWPRLANAALPVLCVAFLVEATAAPIAVNGMTPLTGVVTPEGPLEIGERIPAVYRAVASLPRDAVVVEFPFGVEDYDLRYMLAQAAHRRPLLNGYSGGFPMSFVRHRATLGRVVADPDAAWRELSASSATCAIVHEAAFLPGEGARVSAWLAARGAVPAGTFGADRLFTLPRRR